MNYTSDLIIRLKNANKARHRDVDVLNSNMNIAILDILVFEGYILGYTVLSNSQILVYLKHSTDSNPIAKIRIISKPSKKRVFSIKELLASYSRGERYILSTKKGIFNSYDAISNIVGGEVLCRLS